MSNDNQGKTGPIAPHYDPTDETGNSKEIAKPAKTGPTQADTDVDPKQRERADEVLRNFEGEARPVKPDDF